jgi:GDSL-like Lipase/Acylhydrolase family
MRQRRSGRAALIAAAGMLGILMGAVPAGASGAGKTLSTASRAPSAHYVALGDSFSAGFGNPPWPAAGPYITQQGTTETSPDDGCNRTSTAYPMLVKHWLARDTTLPKMAFNFLACTGATTTDLWSGSPAVADGLTGASGDNGEGTQLGSNYTSDLSNARVVTLSIGGNDLSFVTVIGTCVAAPIDCGSVSTSSSVADLESNIQALEPVLVATYQQVKEEAPNASIYVTGYPDEVPSRPSLVERTVGCGPFLAAAAAEGTTAGPAITYLATAENNLNAVISEAATTAGINYVNPNPSSGSDSFAKHTVCSKIPWFNTLFHPSVTGQAALAKLFEAAAGGVLAGSEWTQVNDSGGCEVQTFESSDQWTADLYGDSGTYSSNSTTFTEVWTSGVDEGGVFTATWSDSLDEYIGNGSGGYHHGSWTGALVPGVVSGC